MTPIVMVFQTTKKTISSIVFIVLGCFSPFLHLFAKPGQEGFLHWKWMSSFLDSLGWGLCALFIGLSMLIDVRYSSQEMKPINRLKAYIVVTIGLFYTFYTFFSIRDFSSTTYYSLLSGISIALTILIHFINRYYLTAEEKFKLAFSKLFRFANRTAPENHVLADESEKYFKSLDTVIEDIDL